MKKNILFLSLFLIFSLVAFAQKHKDADSTEVSSGSGVDVTSIVIGAVVGIAIGYLLGNRTIKK